MRFLVASAILLCARTAVADSPPQITADAPTAGLPALSADGATYARPVIVQPHGCTGVQTFVEVGTVGSDTVESKGTLTMVQDQCSKGFEDKAKANIDAIDKQLADGKFRSVGTMQSRTVPTDIDTTAGVVHVGTSGNACTVALSGSAADHWQVMLDGPVSEVRGWYIGKNPAGASYVAVLVAAKAKDTGDRGRERWLDFWPVEQSAQTEAGAPADIAADWIKALAGHDAAALGKLISVPFWKIGFTPITGPLKKSCKHVDTAKKPSQSGKLARCIAAGASDVYARYKIADNITETDMHEFPDELGKYKKKVAKLVAQGYKLVQYKVSEDGVLVYVELLLDPDTDFQTVGAALESINLD